MKDKKFQCELAFESDIVSHLDVLNLQLQGRGQIITDMYTTVRVFKTKLYLRRTQMLQGNLCQFLCCQTMAEQSSPALLPSAQFAEKSTWSTSSFPDHLLTLRLRKGDLNSSATGLQSTWKMHEPASNWSYLNTNLITFSHQNVTLWVLRGFHVSSLPLCLNCAPKPLRCVQCWAVNIIIIIIIKTFIVRPISTGLIGA